MQYQEIFAFTTSISIIIKVDTKYRGGNISIKGGLMKKALVILVSLTILTTSVWISQASPNSNWQIAGCTPDRKHFSTARITPPLKTAWNTVNEGSVYAVPPLIDNEFCYLGIAQIPEKNNFVLSVQKRELKTGKAVWEYKDAWWPWFVDGDKLIVQGYDPKNKYSWVRRVDTKTLKTIWEVEWVRYTIGALAQNNVIFSLSYSDYEEEDKPHERTFFFQAHSMDNGKLLWKKTYTMNETTVPWFCIQGDHIYTALFKTLYKLDKTTGNEIWKSQLDNKVPRGCFLVGTDKGILLTDPFDRIFLYNTEDGKKIWEKKLSNYDSPDPDNCTMPGATPGIIGNKVYVVSRGYKNKNEPKELFCLDLVTGKTIWQKTLTGTSLVPNTDVGFTVTCASGVVYTTTEDQTGLNTKIRAFDPDSGLMLWSDALKGIVNPSQMSVVTGYLIIGMELPKEHGKSEYYYHTYTNIGVTPPKVVVDEELIDFGYINDKKSRSKEVIIGNEGSGDLIGTAFSPDPWVLLEPTQFQGNNTKILVIAEPSKMKIGPNTGTITIKTNGGSKTIQVKATFGGALTPKKVEEKIEINCTELNGWKKVITFEGFHRGGVAVDAPWLQPNPLVFEGINQSVTLLINKLLIPKNGEQTATVIIKTNAVEMIVTITITGVVSPIAIDMTLGNKTAIVNGKPLTMDVPPQIIFGSTFVPLRFIADAFGVKVDFQATTKTISYTTLDKKLVVMQIGNNIAKVDGKEVKLTAPPQIKSGRTVVPFRFVAESFGATATYNNFTKSINIRLEGCPN
jgi:outer membrane protein assembly factor BamB